MALILTFLGLQEPRGLEDTSPSEKDKARYVISLAPGQVPNTGRAVTGMLEDFVDDCYLTRCTG
jgi:hypothetical protein